MPVLDTNFLIALEAGEQAAHALLESLQQEELVVPDVVAAEYLTGLTALEDREAAMAALEQAFSVRYASRSWVMEAAAFRSGLRKRGAALRSVDAWVACWARLGATYVVTRDGKGFAALGVKTRSW